jgi:hypothetical protein
MQIGFRNLVWRLSICSSAMDRECVLTIGRIIQGNRAGTSSFDHMQKYGLPAPIDTFLEIAKLLDGATVREATWNARSGDMMFQFESDTELQVFNFTGYEAWEIHFANGTGEYSLYAR